jgi:hypothetical protein
MAPSKKKASKHVPESPFSENAPKLKRRNSTDLRHHVVEHVGEHVEDDDGGGSFIPLPVPKSHELFMNLKKESSKNEWSMIILAVALDVHSVLAGIGLGSEDSNNFFPIFGAIVAHKVCKGGGNGKGKGTRKETKCNIT